MGRLWEFENDDMILFWGGLLSNWFKIPFTIDGVQYNSAEQYMMNQKALCFNDTASAAKIMASSNPRDQKLLGRQVINFDKDVWATECYRRSLPGIEAKFKQNDSLRAVLLSTKNKILAEASPYDAIWGIGLATDDPLALDQKNWKGLNLLGKSLMEVRSRL